MPERLRDEVLVRMAAQLRLREILLLAQHFEIGMIARQLAQRLAAPQVGAAVADPGDLRMTIRDARRRRRSSPCSSARCCLRPPAATSSCARFTAARSGSVQRAAEQCLLHERGSPRRRWRGRPCRPRRTTGRSPRPSRSSLRSGLPVGPDVCDAAKRMVAGGQNERCALAAALANCCGLNAVSFFTAL